MTVEIGSRLYDLIVLGQTRSDQIEAVRNSIEEITRSFGLRMGHEIAFSTNPENLDLDQKRSCAVAYFAGENSSDNHLSELIQRSIPILPIVSSKGLVSRELPTILQPINCLFYDEQSPLRIATAMLECVGLLPRQRRVFLSYRRDEAREAAIQLFDSLTSHLFDVFLDTHKIGLAEDFQAVLWHRLCDSDLLVMLDTPGYFDSRWTSAEFGRALAKGISVLRIGWPDSTPSARTATVSRAELLPTEVDKETGRIDTSALDRICWQVEAVRSQSHAVRHLNLISTLRDSIERVGGKFNGIGPRKSISITLANGKNLFVYPTVGVPTSTTMHEATTFDSLNSVAVAYDHIGLHPEWQSHLDWLGTNIQSARWVKASEAAWQFADWQG